MPNTRFQRPRQTNGDTTVSDGTVTVVGVLSRPINQTAFPVLGGILILDEQTGAFWNVLPVLPISAIPSIPFSLIINGSSEIAARIHARQ